MAKARIGVPLLMSRRYIERSLDVSPIEFLSMQLLHHTHTLASPDPFEKSAFARRDLRLQCEREAKRYLLHIRQSLIQCHGRQAMLSQLLHNMLGAVIPMFSAVLYLKNCRSALRESRDD